MINGNKKRFDELLLEKIELKFYKGKQQGSAAHNATSNTAEIM